MSNGDEQEGGRAVGLIGVGIMGYGIATNLLRHGHELVFQDHPGNQPVHDLLAAGATPVETAMQVAADSDIIILCVTGASEVEDVMTRRDGVLAAINQDTVIVDCSTSLPSTSRRMAELASKARCHYIDAPMTRTRKEAMEGRLNLLVGGDAGILAGIRPMLSCFAENITHVGGVGTGHAMKLLHNFVSLGFSAVLAEAAATASRAGVDARVFAEILAKGAGSGVVFERLKPFILEGDASGLAFTISNAQKDLGYYLSLAEEVGAKRLTADGAFTLFNDAVGDGHAGEMVPELIRILS